MRNVLGILKTQPLFEVVSVRHICN